VDHTVDAPWLGVAIVFAFTGLPALLAYGFAFRRHRQLQQMLREWRREPGTIVADERVARGRGNQVHVPTVEWAPEGRIERFTPPDYRRSPAWAVGEAVTLLRHPVDWRLSRLLDPSRFYRQEVWNLVIGGTFPLLALMALVAERWGWIPRPGS
jgi:hypothetical protein